MNLFYLLTLLTLCVITIQAWINPDCYAQIMAGNRTCLGISFKKTPSPKIVDCGLRNGFVPNIAGGDDSVPGEWPWMARLLYPDDNWCGGTLVSPYHVVTAAHCIKGQSKAPVKVRLGDTDTETEYDCLDPNPRFDQECKKGSRACFLDEACVPKHVDIDIKDFKIHERYSECSDNGCVPVFDVAIITLKTRVKFSEFIYPVCLPPKRSSRETNNLVITGWGNTAEEFDVYQPAKKLQKLDVKYVPLEDCNVDWRRKLGSGRSQFDLRPSHMCVIGEMPGQSSCHGDSGGPLVRLFDVSGDRWELAGIVSFGLARCGDISLPLGFTRVAGEVNLWLRNVIGSDLPNHD